ncbi:MAG: PAQR family membrane homeostasis protein TrhA [Gemmatimonadota bacterium]
MRGATERRVNREELINTTTHAAGIAASAAGGALLIVMAALQGGARLIVGVSVFVATLLVLYSASTLYHAAGGDSARRRLKVFDHAAIYLLIAGTYTPFTLAGMRGAWGWSLFGVIWGLALAGVVFKLFFTGRFKRMSTAIYVAMGWLVLIAIVPLVRALEPVTLSWLVAGGITYTLGTLFYLSRRPYAHGVWHLFVLGGSVCHAVAVATL